MLKQISLCATIDQWIRLRAPGSSPKHTVYAFFNLHLNCITWKRRKVTKRDRDWLIFNKALWLVKRSLVTWSIQSKGFFTIG